MMSLECGECEHDLRGGHSPGCSRYEAPSLWVRDEDEEGLTGHIRRATPAEVAAAAREQGMVNLRCETCRRPGGMNVGKVGPIPTGNDTWRYDTCPDCVEGIPKTLIEAGGDAMLDQEIPPELIARWPENWTEKTERMALAALLAIRDQETHR